MKNKAIVPSMILMMAAVCACGYAAAEQESAYGEYPERGLLLPMTRQDEELGMQVMTGVMDLGGGTALPLLEIAYYGPEAQAAAEAYFEAEQAGDEQAKEQALEAYRTHACGLAAIYLFDETLYGQIGEQMLDAGLQTMGENDGYIYLYERAKGFENAAPEDAVRYEQCRMRVDEMIQNVTFTDIVWEQTPESGLSGAFPAFTVQTIDGETVTQELFSGHTLTVVNIWGTYCGPCVNEMPDLAAWSREMPEGMQLVGLVCDLPDLENTRTLNTARQILEATGADGYMHLTAGEDLMGLLSHVVGVPTTLFVDESGMIVGEPVVGADVRRCRAFAEAYMAEQEAK